MMIDGGFSAPHITEEDAGNFEDVRRIRNDQWRFFLGEDLSGIPTGGLQGGLGGGMTSGNRRYITRGTDDGLPLKTDNAQILQTLAKGGLGAVWGAACSYFSNEELTSMNLPPDEMQESYKAVTKLIGISGPASSYGTQPPLKPDHNAEAILKRGAGHDLRPFVNEWTEVPDSHQESKKMRVEQPYSAVLTEDLGSRRAYDYTDMEYYTDPSRSVWRPQYLIEELQKHPHFRYEPGWIAERISEDDQGATVYVRSMGRPLPLTPSRGEGGKEEMTFTAKRIVLAAGAVGTARILLRSFGLHVQDIPFVAKPHAFIACLHPRMFGRSGPKERGSLCQLLVTDEEKTADHFDAACAQIYSYRSLLLFRLIASLPLPAPEALALASLLTPSLMIADIRFPAGPEGNSLRLNSETDAVQISMQPSEQEKQNHAITLKRMRKNLRSLGLLPIRTMMLPEGSSSHYAGTVPVRSEKGATPLSTDANGKLHQGKHIFVADASVFPILPPKPHTLTIMANAERIAGHLLKSLPS